jgi:hypothetical protein
MLFNKMFRQPYLDVDDGTNIGGGIEPPQEPLNEPQLNNEPSPTPQGENEPLEPQIPQTIKVKYNHQEMELPYDEAVANIQKGMNYDKAIEKARQEARDSYIADQGYMWNDKPITTETEYKQALKEKEIYDKYQAQGLPDEVVQELVESKKFREQFESERKTKAEQDKKNAEYQEFFEYFKGENGRDFNSATDTISQDVWDLVNKGKTLTDAYAYNINKQLKAKIAEFEGKLKAQETNQANAGSSPGSVTGNGGTKGDFISKEVYETNKGNQQWLLRNYDTLKKSMNKWGK